MIFLFKLSIANPSAFIPVSVDVENEIAEFVVIDPRSKTSTDVTANISNGRVDHHLLKDGIYIQSYLGGPVMKILNSILDTSGLELVEAQNGIFREICQVPLSKVNRSFSDIMPDNTVSPLCMEHIHSTPTAKKNDNVPLIHPGINVPQFHPAIITPLAVEQIEPVSTSNNDVDFNLEDETSLQLFPLIASSDADPHLGPNLSNSIIESRTVLQRLIQILGIQYGNDLHNPGMDVTVIPTTIDFSLAAVKVANIALCEVSNRVLDIAFSKCDIENSLQCGVGTTMKEIVLFVHVAQMCSIETDRYPFLLDNESRLYLCHPMARSFNRDLSLAASCMISANRALSRCAEMMIEASNEPSPPMNMAMGIRMDDKIFAMRGYLLCCLNRALWSVGEYGKCPFNFAATLQGIVACIRSIRRGNCETTGLSEGSADLVEGILSYVLHENVGSVKKVPIFVFKNMDGDTISWIVHPTVAL